MQLLIDDVRTFSSNDVIARNARAARLILSTEEVWDLIMFDHDLGHNSETGYDILKWAIQTDNLRTDVIQLITMNPVGRDNMTFLLLNSGWSKLSDFKFRKIWSEE